MKIALLPLDDRPCSYEHVIELGAIAGIEVIAPERDLIASQTPGRYSEAEYRSTRDWLMDILPTVDAAIISVDQWLYGGLIHSRKMGVSTAGALRRLQDLAEITARYPRTRVYLSNILLRLSVTVTRSHGTQVWERVFRYSVLKDQVSSSERSGNVQPELEAELHDLERLIPPTVLEEYLLARERNHQVNLALLSTAGLADRASYTIYGQEDCAPYGLHRIEKTRLLESCAILAPDARNRVTVLTGADEISSILLMRAYMDHLGRGEGLIHVDLRLSHPDGLERVSAYEDIPAKENLDLHLKPSIFRRADRGPMGETGETGAPSWAIYTGSPNTQQEDLCFLRTAPLDAEAPVFACSLLAGTSLLDLSYSNGANPALVESALNALPGAWRDLGAFSGWNTTGNRLGTWIAHMTISTLAREHGELDPQAERQVLATHLLDDYLYQSLVRGKLTAEAEEQGLDIWALPREAHLRLSRRCHELLQAEAARLGLPAHFTAALPWPRLFEVSIIWH